MDVYGCLWMFRMFMDVCVWMCVCGCLWMFMDVYGCLWMFMNVYECLWMFMVIFAIVRGVKKNNLRNLGASSFLWNQWIDFIGLISWIFTSDAGKWASTCFNQLNQVTKTDLIGGFSPSEKYDSQLGWWHSQYMESHKIHVPNHQSVTGPVNTESVPGVRDGGLLIVQKLGLLPNEWRHNPWRIHGAAIYANIKGAYHI